MRLQEAKVIQSVHLCPLSVIQNQKCGLMTEHATTYKNQNGEPCRNLMRGFSGLCMKMVREKYVMYIKQCVPTKACEG